MLGHTVEHFNVSGANFVFPKSCGVNSPESCGADFAVTIFKTVTVPRLFTEVAMFRWWEKWGFSIGKQILIWAPRIVLLLDEEWKSSTHLASILLLRPLLLAWGFLSYRKSRAFLVPSVDFRRQFEFSDDTHLQFEFSECSRLSFVNQLELFER